MKKPKRHLKMKKDELISVIIPVYNVENYILRCLKSIRTQIYENLEILVIDDGSTDGSGAICDTFAKNDKRVQVFHRKNGGLSDARNFGIKKARGVFIALVDGDDYVAKSFIQDLHLAITENEADIAICGYNDIIPEAKTIEGDEAAGQLLVRQENLEIVAWNKMYKKELFKNIKYPVGKKHEDSLTTYKLLSKAKKVTYIQKAGYFYEQKRCGSIMDSGKIEERLQARLTAALESCEYFKNKKNLLAAAKIAVLSARFAFIDAAVRGEIDKKYLLENILWIKQNWTGYRNNPKITKKLNLYVLLLRLGLYDTFRRLYFACRTK